MPLKTTKKPGWRLENSSEFSTPTSESPAEIAFRPSLAAAARPELWGIEASTIVHPFWPAGHAIKVPPLGGGGGGGGSGSVGVVSVDVVPGSVPVGSVVVGPGPVPVPTGTDSLVAA